MKEETDLTFIDNEDSNSPIEKSNNKKKSVLALGVSSLIVFLTKFKWISTIVLPIFKILATFLKLSKFGTTAISMVATIGIYAFTYGFWYGLGIVILIFIHEMGHYLAARRLSLKVTGPVFIPFIGAFIGMKEGPKDAITEAKVAYGGPFLGFLGGVLFIAIYWVTGNKLVLALAYTGFIINIFNLLPVHPLDGGRIVTAITPYLWFIGIPILLLFLFISFHPLLLLIIILGISQAYKHWKNKDNDYYKLEPKTKAIFAVLYFGLIIALVVGTVYAMGLEKINRG